MNKDTIKKYETRYFTDISRYLNVHQLASLLQYGADADDENRDLSEREEAAKERMINSVKMRKCDTEKVISGFEEYGKTMQSTYFEIGVQIGICLQAELILKQDKVSEKGKMMIGTTEFKEYLFDVINESIEPVFREVKVDEESGEIVVEVFDGSEFVVRCERK